MKKILVFLTIGIVIIVIFNLSQINPNQSWVDTDSGGFWRTNPNGMTSDNIGENEGDIARGIFFLVIATIIISFFNTWEKKDSRNAMPQWARELPQHLRPSNDQIHRLEEVRNQAGISNSEFFMHISSHPETTHRLHRYLYDQVKQQDPSASEQNILKLLILNRLTISAGSNLFGLETCVTDEETFDKHIQEIIEMYPSVEALTEAIVQEERKDGSTSPVYYLDKGNYFMSLGDYASATEMYDKVTMLVKVAGEDDMPSDFYLAKAVAMGEVGRADEAIALYDKLYPSGDNPFIIFTKGIALENAGRDEEALNMVEKALKMHPDSKDFLNKRDNLLEKVKKTNESK